VLLFVIVIDAGTAVCPTVTLAGNVGATDRPAPAAAGLAGRIPTMIATVSAATHAVHREVTNRRIVINLPTRRPLRVTVVPFASASERAPLET
jgi:hypothetical protein